MARPRDKVIGVRNCLILTAYKTYRLSQSQIAVMFGLSRNTVHMVVKDRTGLSTERFHN